MNKQLRAFLESLGLRSDATVQQAWAYYAAINDAEHKRTALALKNGEEPAPAAAGVGGHQRSEPGAGSASQGQQNTQAPSSAAAPAQAPAPAGVNTRTAADIELERRDAIEALCRRYEVDADTRTQAITERWSVERLTNQLLENTRSRPEPVGQHAPMGFARSSNMNIQTLAAGLAIRTGGDPIRVAAATLDRSLAGDERQRAAERLANQASDYRDLSLIDLCRASLAATNQPVPMQRDELIRAAVSTGALGRVMEPALNATLNQAYLETPDNTSLFCTEADVPDYRKNERHGLGKVATPKKRHRGQTAGHSTISDRPVEEYKVFEYSEILRIDRQDIIDDRTDVFQRWPMEMGQAFRRLRPQLVYYMLIANAALADTLALFHGDHNNLNDLLLTVDNLEAVIAKMRRQQLSGVSIQPEPGVLIVNSDLEFTARRILGSSELITGASATLGNRNVVADLGMQLAVSADLRNGVTDPNTGATASGATTKWFVAAKKGTAPTIEVGYVAGLGRMPQTNTFARQGDGGFWGVEYAASHSVGAKVLDHLGLQIGDA